MRASEKGATVTCRLMLGRGYQRSGTGRVRKRRASPTVGRIQAQCEAATIAWSRSIILDRAEDDLEGLEVFVGTWGNASD